MLQAPRPKTIIVPEGTHVARCIGLIHVGTVPVEWSGREQMTNKIRLSFEFPEEVAQFKEGEEERPFVTSQEYKLSMHPKSSLRPVVEGMVGGLSDDEAYNFDVEEVLGRACLITIKHEESKKGNIYARISSVSSLMKGQEAKPPYNEIRKLTYQQWDQEYFESLPEFIQDSVKASKEYKALKGISEEKIEPEVTQGDE